MSEYAGVDNLERMSHAINYNQFLIEQIKGCACAGDKVLDFGAGDGFFAEAMNQLGFDVLCVEPDPALREIITGRGLEACMSLDEIGDATLDYIYSMNVLEHIVDDRAVIGALYRTLRPKGRILIYTPAFECLFTSMDEKVGHVRRYTRSGLSERLAQAGFGITVSRYADSLGFFATLAYKWLGSRSGDINLGSLVLYDRFVFPLSRILDRLTGRVFGKNVLVVGTKQSS